MGHAGRWRLASTAAAVIGAGALVLLVVGPRHPAIRLAAGAALLVGFLVVAAATRTGRERRRPLPSPTEFGDVMDFLQRLAEASGVAGVGLLVAEEARQLAGARGVVLLTGRDLTVVAGRAGDMRVMTSLPLVRSVVERAAPHRVVGDTAQLYVPVVHRGVVVGMIAAVRSADQPFTEAEEDRIVLLGPHLGSSLVRAAEHDTARELAYVDDLTRLANRRRLDHDLPRTLEGWLGAGRTVAFAMVDVDHFKAVNDAHGHPAGDELLKTVARILTLHVRAEDVVYRYGGEEFCILLPGATAAEALTVAERVRDAVARHASVRLPDGRVARVTVSVGVALADGPEVERLVGAADRALYEAKHAGRNRTVLRPPGARP